jgi:hypothetical protein
VLAGGAAVIAVLVLGRRGRRRDEVELYFEDGSTVTVAAASPDGERLLPLARDIIHAARA